MGRDAIWQAIDAQRLSVVTLLEGLSDVEWAQPSLCTQWSVREVAAHLTMQELGLRDLAGIIGPLVRVRGDMDRVIGDATRARAAEPTQRLVAAIRAGVGSRRHNLGVTHRETLIDILVHSQDIAIPLGRRFDLPVDAAAVAATRCLTMRWPPPFPAAKAMRAFRLSATDCDWSAGSGPQVQAPIGTILLLLAGRLVALPEVSGEGAGELTARLATLAAA